MKRTFIFLLAAGMITSCNTTTEDKTKGDAKVAGASDTATTKMDYAYTTEHGGQWETGNAENTKMVLASLKKWEMGDFDGAIKDFADTVSLNFDAFEAKLPKDSAKIVFASERKNYKSMQIIMDDFESVRSKDGKAEYVSLWYKEKWEDQKGMWDSLSVMDDCRIKDGKLNSIDEKIRHYPKKKM